MRVKEGANIQTSNFINDIFEGYIKAESVLVDQADIERVNEAIRTIQEFELDTEEVTEIS